MSQKCCPVVAANCDADAEEPRAACSFTYPLERIAKAAEAKAPCASSCGSGCGASEEAESSRQEDVPEGAPCLSAVSEGYPTMTQACEWPDNTRCVGQVCVPRDCKPLPCILLRPMLADSPPKAPSSVTPVASDSPDQRPLAASVPRAGPAVLQVWGVSPMIQTTVLRI
jgi:hypothetical protein